MTWIAEGASAALVLALAAACSSNDATCDCVDPGITISIPADIAASVTGVQVGGSACAGVTPTCVNQTGGCSQYRFDANAAGTCRVEVDYASGVFAANVTVAQTTGCCAGFYATPASAGSIDVPESDGGAS